MTPRGRAHSNADREALRADGEPEDPAYAQTSPWAPDQRETDESSQLVRLPLLTGVLVDEVPADARELPNLTHDSHTQFRRDGVGPRIYDPDTKQTVLSAQRRVEE